MQKKLLPEVGQQAQSREQLYSLSPVQTSEHHASGTIQPTWIRLPKSGQLCPYTQLSRSVMNGLILGANAPVRSLSLRRQYALKGTRLIHLGSLLAYLESVASSQHEESKTT